MDEEKTAEMTEAVPQPAETDSPAPDEDRQLCGMLSEKLDGLRTLAEGLKEAFDDKIAEDEHKNRLFDNMHRELTKYQNGLIDKIVDTMALDIIQLTDSTKRNYQVYEQKEPTEENYRKLLRCLKGIAEDLDDILYRQDIEAYSVPGDDADVRRQKIIQTVDTDDPQMDNKIAARTAEGYTHGESVLRPERIKIYKYNPDKKAAPPEEA